MHRFYCSSQNISGDKITLEDKNQVYHLRDVLRLHPKDAVIIFDDKGNEYSCVIQKLCPKVSLDIKDKRLFSQNKQRFKITVACAIPKKAKMGEIIDKLTQLGVDEIIPLQTKRVIVNLDDKKKEIRLARWQKIALNSSLQSQRKQIPVVGPIKNIKEVLSQSADFDLKLIPALFGRRRSLKYILKQSHPKNILVLIGPEGDFSPEELAMAIKTGCIPVTLGELVLRVDTAAVCVVGFIRLYADS
jgi:16S rRNA (uracil1498-N3)-methyltransferase